MKIALLGDIAFIGKMSLKANTSVVDYFTEVSNYLSSFDYVVANLETPFSELKKTDGAKSAYICSDVENVQILKDLHINAVSLANNHMFDYGIEGYETTKKVLSNYGIEYFGTEGREVLIEKAGNKLAFSGFCCYSSNPLFCVRNGNYGVNAYNIDDVVNVLKRNDNKGYINIVSVHAGLEHVNYPSIDHVRAARFLAAKYSYVYYGHHPHVIQGVEQYKGSIIAHSLGNFCFDDVYIDNSSIPLVKLTENNRTGVILELEIQNNKVVAWREQIIYISENGHIKLVDDLLDINEYNKELIKCEENEIEYNERRCRIVTSRMTERKANRNLAWYIKRLRPRYFKILLNAHRNGKEFNNNVLKYIIKDEDRDL